MHQVAGTVILLFCLAGAAQALWCYTCEGSSNFVEKDRCGDTYEAVADHVKMCNKSAGEIYCRKMKFGVKNVLDKIERGCTAECEPHNVLYTHREFCCEEDGCNTASHVTMASLALPIVASIIGKLATVI